MRTAVAASAILMLAASCGGGQNGKPDGGGSLPMAGAPSAAAQAVASDLRPPGTGALDSGAVIRAMLIDPLSSLVAGRGAIVQGVVTGDVAGSDAQVAIPSGSLLDIRVDRLEAARDASGPAGVVRLSPVAVHIRGDTVRLAGTIDSVPFLARGANVIVERATPLVIHLTARVRRRP